jgi:hypothetical protein
VKVDWGVVNRRRRGGLAEAFWAEAFRSAPKIGPHRYLQGNLVIGLFMGVVLIAGTHRPERTNWAFFFLVGATIATALVGWITATVSARVRVEAPRIVFIQAATLAVTVAFLATTTILFAFTAPALVNFRYVPGVALSLLTYASIQVEFFGPPAVRRLRPRRIGIATGIVVEVVLAGALVFRLVGAGQV